MDGPRPHATPTRSAATCWLDHARTAAMRVRFGHEPARREARRAAGARHEEPNRHSATRRKIVRDRLTIAHHDARNARTALIRDSHRPPSHDSSGTSPWLSPRARYLRPMSLIGRRSGPASPPASAPVAAEDPAKRRPAMSPFARIQASDAQAQRTRQTACWCAKRCSNSTRSLAHKRSRRNHLRGDARSQRTPLTQPVALLVLCGRAGWRLCSASSC